MLNNTEVVEVVSATNRFLGFFDKIGGQIKAVILGDPKEAEAGEGRWRHRINGEDDKLIVRQDGRTIQIITGDEIARKLSPDDLVLVRTYEQRMGRNYKLWQATYPEKGASSDRQVNEQTDQKINALIRKMKEDITGIIDFLASLGVMLDDHYMHIRQLVGDIQ
jgi:hypothetical protein